MEIPIKVEKANTAGSPETSIHKNLGLSQGQIPEDYNP
jgi:hypothetical protein